MAETGHVLNVSNLKKAKDIATGWGGKYQPSNPDLEIGAMGTLQTAAEAALDDVQVKKAPWRNATATCDDAFEALTPLAQRIRRTAKGSGCPQSFLDDLATPIRKILGYRAKAKKKDDPSTPEDESKQNNSAAQTSRQQRIEFLDEARALLEGQPLYKPNEADLKTDAIKDFSVELQAKVDAISTAFVPYSNALDARDAVLYDDPTNVYKTGTAFKAYVEGAFGRNSGEWNQVKGLEFRNLSRTK